jgi:outer membrane PBP1 activator LpoA protein
MKIREMTPEQRSEYYAKWRKEYYSKPMNQRKLKKQQQKYYSQNREDILAAKKEDYKTNATQIKVDRALKAKTKRQKYDATRRDSNKDEIKAKRILNKKNA